MIKSMWIHVLGRLSRFLKLIPHAKVTVLPEAGHTLTGLADEIMAFLRYEEGAAKE